MKEGLKPSLATTHAKASRRVIATLWAGRTLRLGPYDTSLFRVPSPRRSVTRARRLYVSSLANFRSSDRPQIRGSAQGRALPTMRQGRRIGHDSLQWRLSP
ncbi:MAG TPA: hypothetical protein VIM51_05975 [Desulfosporosinus sp.]